MGMRGNVVPLKAIFPHPSTPVKNPRSSLGDGSRTHEAFCCSYEYHNIATKLKNVNNPTKEPIYNNLLYIKFVL